MAIRVSANNLPATGAALVYILKEFLKNPAGSAVWTVVKSGDGLAAYNAAGDVITSNGTGANGMNNNKAWFVIRMPGSTREFCFQRGSSSSEHFRLKYSVSGFSSGAPNATTCPSATDEQVIWVGGTDSAPSGSLIAPTANLNRQSVWMDDASPYGWGVIGWTTAGVINTGFHLDACAAGSYPTEDVDPYVLYFTRIGASDFGVLNTYSGNWHQCWIAKGLGGATFGTVSGLVYHSQGAGTAIPNINTPANLHNSKDDTLPIPYGKAGSYWKGFSTYTKWAVTTRATLSTISVVSPGAKDRLVVGAVSIPWGGVDPLL